MSIKNNQCMIIDQEENVLPLENVYNVLIEVVKGRRN